MHIKTVNKKNKAYAIYLSVIILAVVMVSALTAYAASVQNIRFGKHSHKTRIVLEMDRNQAFRAFTLSDPYRIVIDLPAFTWRAHNAKAPSWAGISNIRHGQLKPGISRIVMDAAKPPELKSAFTLPASGSKPDRLVIDFANTSAIDFKNTKNMVLGKLDVGHAATHLNKKPAAPIMPDRKPMPNMTGIKETKPLIIIDAGHGGVDPGAIAKNGVFEKHITLKLAKQLQKILEDLGHYRVKLSRENDKFVKLRDRVIFARDQGGDLFVSIHADFLERENVSGASVYTLSETASDSQTAKLAARENRADLIAGIDLSIEDEEVANILVDLAMRDTMNQSKFFANKLVKSFQTKNVKTLKTPHRSAGFAVLKAPDIPSILVEAGFLSNRKEAERLNTYAHRQKIAEAIKIGIDTYFDQVRKNRRM